MAAKQKVRAPLESALKRTILTYLARNWPQAQVRKRHGTVYTTAGDPDLYFLLDGIHVECELKQPGKEPTRIQQHRLLQWSKAGALTVVIHTLAELVTFMEANFGPPLASPARRSPPVAR